MTESGFESVISWLYAERDYQLTKFNYDEEAEKPVDYWIQQFDSYIQRLPIFGLETLQGKQAALKLAATAVALCEHLAETPEGLPAPRVPSGDIKTWNKDV